MLLEARVHESSKKGQSLHQQKLLAPTESTVPETPRL